MSALKNLKLTVAYDGTDYCGFQRQSGNLPTIQGCLESALGELCGEVVQIVGAGRTDAGVHARGQVISFGANVMVPVDRLPYAINSHLPDAIIVTGACEVPSGFCARKSAISKTYIYRVQRGSFSCPLRRRYSWHRSGELDIERMRDCARVLVGKHDFRAFSRAGSSAVTSERTVSRLDIDAGEDVTITVQADGFLYAMVRLIVGTLVEVGERRLDIASVRAALVSGQRGCVGATAPPQGLCLEAVRY